MSLSKSGYFQAVVIIALVLYLLSLNILCSEMSSEICTLVHRKSNLKLILSIQLKCLDLKLAIYIFLNDFCDWSDSSREEEIYLESWCEFNTSVRPKPLLWFRSVRYQSEKWKKKVWGSEKKPLSAPIPILKLELAFDSWYQNLVSVVHYSIQNLENGSDIKIVLMLFWVWNTQSYHS